MLNFLSGRNKKIIPDFDILTMKVIKCFLIFIVVGFFGFQALQHTYPLVRQKKLSDVPDSTKCPKLTFESYSESQFQPVFEKYIEERMGFRGFSIRLKNQVDYSVFNFTQTQFVVIGKNRMLLPENCIRNYKGIDFKGVERIRNEVRRLKMIQDELKKHNVDFLLIFAPGKATYFSELIPDHYKQRPNTNYKTYINAISGSGIHFIDMNSWFLQMKENAKYPLYPLNGAHWNSYGISLAADSMLRYIEKLRNIDLPDFSWSQATLSDSLTYRDNDIGVMMNLIKPLKNDPMPYFHFRYINAGKVKPRLIAIGDSYWFGFTETGIIKHVFANNRFWNYFRDDFINDRVAGNVANLDIEKELYNQDLVILITTESNYQIFPFGFIDGFFDRCLPDSPEKSIMKKEKVVNSIIDNPEWYRLIVKKAKSNGISVEEQLSRDAQFIFDQDNKK